MLSKSKSNKSLLKNKQFSLQHLNKINTFLDGQQFQTQYVNKQIKNQIQIAKKNDQIINKTFYKISQDGETLIRKYEEEKQKCEKLQFLVKHIEDEIFSSKMEKANDLKNNIEADKLVELTSVLVSSEKNIEKICQKTNNSSYDLSKKCDTIRALRSQRTIVSALFDKIERELCNLEHCYKMLVIQRKKEEDQLEQVLGQFNKCQTSGYKELLKLKDKGERLKEGKKVHAKINGDSQLQGDKGDQVVSMASILNEEVTSRTPLHTQSQFSKERDRLKQKNYKFQADLMKIDRERMIKTIFNELGISSAKELPQDVSSLQTINEQLLKQADHLYESIITAQRSVRKLSSGARTQKHSFRKQEMQNKIAGMTKCSEDIKKSRAQLMEFKQTCKIMLSSIQEGHNKQMEQPQFLNEQQQIVYYMGEIESHFEKSYIQSMDCLSKAKKQRSQPKRLTFLLTNNQMQRNIMSIYEQKDLLQIAKKNLQRLEKMEKSQNKFQR